MAPKVSLASIRRQTKIKDPSGQVFHCVDHREVEGLYREIYEEEVYRKHGIEFSDNMVIFDVGANIGMAATYFSTKSRGAQIFCFEPLPPTFEVLQRNIQEHKLASVQALPIGLSDRGGTAEFSFYPYSAGWSTMQPNHSPEFLDVIRSDIRNYDRLPWALKALFRAPIIGRIFIELVLHFKMKRQTYACALSTLSDVTKQYQIDRIDLLKIDVERAELSVLQGIADEDWPKISQIVIEVQKDVDPLSSEKITRLLQTKGFHVTDEPASYLLKEDGTSMNSTLYAVRKSA